MKNISSRRRRLPLGAQRHATDGKSAIAPADKTAAALLSSAVRCRPSCLPFTTAFVTFFIVDVPLQQSAPRFGSRWTPRCVRRCSAVRVLVSLSGSAKLDCRGM
eukprot:6185603-Pleurochrysis_carterae.AAC.8